MNAERVFAGWLMAAALGIGGCSATQAPTQSPSPPPIFASSNPAPTPGVPGVVEGAYLNFATCDPNTLHQRTGTTQVYFFSQADCADCATTDANLTATGVPDGFTVFKVDLPSMPALAEQYGVTEPHTFVQIDDNATLVRSWTGSLDGADIAAHTT